MKKNNQTRRNILALSGGKDSAALAVYMRKVRKVENLEYVFMDTGYELPETYDFLNRMRAILGIEITALKPKRNFDFWLKIYGGCLPSPQNRWCTRQLKIEPFENFIGDDSAFSYIALRADEDRMGYFSNQNNIVPYYPFIEDGLVKADVVNLLNEVGLGLPEYYAWRSRSGCFFCFFQRRIEWIGLYDNHPKLFEKASRYEKDHADGREYSWIQGETLESLIERRESVIKQWKEEQKGVGKMDKKIVSWANSIGFNKNGKVFDNEFLNLEQREKEKPCLICQL